MASWRRSFHVARTTLRTYCFRMRTVLVTGFEPFGGDSRNPSADIARALHGREVEGRLLHGAVLDCIFGESLAELGRLLEGIRPDAVVCLGVATNRHAITPERIAINIDDARIPDNAGHQPVDQRVVPDGPAAYWSTLPVKAILSALEVRGIPARISESAGTFVCNHVFFGLMHALREHSEIPAGFIHVPCDSPALPIETLTEAISLAIQITLRAAPVTRPWADRR